MSVSAGVLPHRRVAKASEPLFALTRKSDQAHGRCELKDCGGEFGVEVQFFFDDQLAVGRRFFSRPEAVRWAHRQRWQFEHEG